MTSGTTAMVITNQQQLILNTEQWNLPPVEGYKYTQILHRLGDELTVGSTWYQPTGLTLASNQGGVAGYVASDRLLLIGGRVFFKFAKLLKISINIEWLGSVTQQEDLRYTDQTTEPPQEKTARLEFKKSGTTLMYKLLHERFDRGVNDGQNDQALAPADMLGWNRKPILLWPDVWDTSTNTRGQVVLNDLCTPGNCKLIKFTQERRFKTLVFKPLSKCDKLGATFDLNKLQSGTGTWDRDQRCGALWLGQEEPLGAAGQAWNPEGLPGIWVGARTQEYDFFRITYRYTWKFFSRRPVATQIF